MGSISTANAFATHSFTLCASPGHFLLHYLDTNRCKTLMLVIQPRSHLVINHGAASMENTNVRLCGQTCQGLFVHCIKLQYDVFHKRRHLQVIRGQMSKGIFTFPVLLVTEVSQSFADSHFKRNVGIYLIWTERWINASVSGIHSSSRLLQCWTCGVTSSLG